MMYLENASIPTWTLRDVVECDGVVIEIPLLAFFVEEADVPVINMGD
jgi:hypothetical protein